MSLHNNEWRHQSGYGTTSMEEERFRQLNQLIGYPVDRQNDDLWLTAITHSSYSGGPQGANAGLARLGDVAMKTVQAVVIHRVGRGDNGKLHSDTIQRRLAGAPLEEACKKYGLQDLAYHRVDELKEGPCAELVKAIIGAVYIDCVSRAWNPMEEIERVMQNLELLDYDPQEDPPTQQVSQIQQASGTQQPPRSQPASRMQQASRNQPASRTQLASRTQQFSQSQGTQRYQPLNFT